MPLEIDQAQTLIYPRAVESCNGKQPLFGKYAFDSSEPIAQGSGASSFAFQQEIQCTNETAVAELPKQLEITAAQEETIKSAAEQMTEQFLSALESDQFKKAYDMLDSGLKDLAEFQSWESKKSDYYGESLGNLITRDIWRITLYNNPPNSPKAGLYIAADYENSYENSSIHCGYVMWYLPEPTSDEYSIMREEFGEITEDSLKSSSKENLQDIRKQFGCRAL